MPSTTMRAVLLAAAVGLLVVLITWMVGPSVFAGADEPERVVTATVAEPAPCADANAVEKVTFTDLGKKTTANFPACGHDRGEKLQVAVPETVDGVLTVRAADTSTGHTGSRQSLGLLLVALSCIGGGVYAYLVARTRTRRRGQSGPSRQGQRTEPAPAA